MRRESAAGRVAIHRKSMDVHQDAQGGREHRGNYAARTARYTMNGLRADPRAGSGSSETPKTSGARKPRGWSSTHRTAGRPKASADADRGRPRDALCPDAGTIGNTTPSEARPRRRAVRGTARSARRGLQFVSGAGGGELFRVIANPTIRIRARRNRSFPVTYLLTFEPSAQRPAMASRHANLRDGFAAWVCRCRHRAGIRRQSSHAARTEKGHRQADLLRHAGAATGIPLTLTDLP
jgi:hypothetical protein